MTKLPRTILAMLIAILLAMPTPAPNLFVNATQPNAPPKAATRTNNDHGIATYQPHPKQGLKRIFQWGLATVERIYDGHMVSELISTFVHNANHIFEIMVTNFSEWSSEKLTLSYDQLHEKESRRLQQFDAEFSELMTLRNKIERRCIYSKREEERSVCIDKEMDIHEKIQALRERRVKSAKAIERYEGWIAWCASYNNWFC